EAIGLYQDLIKISKSSASNDVWTIAAMGKLASAYEKQKEFNKVEDLWRQVVAITQQSAGTNPTRTGTALAVLGKFLLDQKRYVDAEPVLRESLRIREEHWPDLWATVNTRSLLGCAVLGQKKFSEA